MNALTTWSGAALALVFVAMAAGSRSTTIRAWQADRLAARVGLGVPRDLEKQIRGRVGRRMLGFAAGGLVGLISGLAANGVVHGPSDLLGFYLVVGASTTGAAIGQAVVSFSQVFAADRRPRIARLSDVVLANYVPTALRMIAWALVVVAVITVLLGIGAHASAVALGSAALIGVAVLSLAALEVLGRRLAARGQAATTTDELVWDDAFRASCLAEMLYAPQYFLCMGGVASAIFGWSPRHAWAALPATLLLLGSVLLSRTHRETNTWYLQELWPGSRRRTPEEEEARSTATPDPDRPGIRRTPV